MKRTLALTGLGLSLMISTLTAQAAGLTSQQSSFGKLPDGTPIEKFVLSNSHGMQATVITYGGVLQALKVPDRKGHSEDVVLGFDDVQGYLDNPTVFFGATRSPRTTRPTPCTAAPRASIPRYGRPSRPRVMAGSA